MVEKHSGRALQSGRNPSNVPANANHQSWLDDQDGKSIFFHQKLHEYGLLKIAYAIEAVEGEKLEWILQQLAITESAWNKVIHNGIKPVRVFAHPTVLTTILRSVGYYRMMSLVSLKSMHNIKLASDSYERQHKPRFPDPETALHLSQRFNELISRLIEADEVLDQREFDLWRGMTAGSSAQGSWQNRKGDLAEELVMGYVRQRLENREMIIEENTEGTRATLVDGRIIEFSSDPDIAIYNSSRQVLSTIEIKGGIDPAGVLERIGAALKSLSRAKHDNPEATTILMLQQSSLTLQAEAELKNHRREINYWYAVEDFVNDEAMRQEIFNLLEI